MLMTRTIRHTQCARAFTLLEVIVVVILLGVLAGVLLPRLGGNSSRAARLEAMALRDLLTVAAERDALSGSSVAIEYDAKDERFSLLTLREVSEKDGVTVQWRADPLVVPVQLSVLRLISAETDVQPLDDRSGFILDLAGAGLGGGGAGGIRPPLTMLLAQRDLRGDASGARWRIELPSDAGAALAMDAARPAHATRVIDLDATGRSDDPW
jgi:prepilin-type N-terminal cleavage/methylation domain-containing protein